MPLLVAAMDAADADFDNGDEPTLPVAGTVIAESIKSDAADGADAGRNAAEAPTPMEDVSEHPPAAAVSSAVSTARSSRTSDLSGSTTDWADADAMA